LSTEFSNQLQSNQPDFLRFPIVRRITQSKMLNVVEHIRNRLLNWSLELEQQGILGENLQFSQQDKVRAPMTTNNFHFNGNINNAGVIGAENHGFNQHNV
ncbi:AbiTii domain-containing protein, partial [Klebsiella pneumoniae]